MRSGLIRLVFIWIFFLFQFVQVSAQSWMNGYNYRKKITIDKNKVAIGAPPPYKDLTDFPVLIEFEDSDLKYINGHCGSGIQTMEGKGISFALSTDPTVPLSFQLEAFNPANGKITCWVKIPSLSARETASLSISIYLYYGSALLHDPYSLQNLNTWSADFTRVWHMNPDVAPAESKNAQSNLPQQSTTGSLGITSAHYTQAKLNKGITLNGLSEYLSSDLETTNPDLTISAWIKLKAIGTEQIIVTNKIQEGANTNGYVLSVSSSGELVFDLYKGNAAVSTIRSISLLIPDTWYYVGGIASGGTYNIFINGMIVRSKSGTVPRLGAGGAIKIGSSKNGDQYFKGIIDELRIQKVGRSIAWISTEYVNQNNPSDFYVVGAEEYSSAGFAKFTGASNSSWNMASNWSNGTVPLNGAQVIITAGKAAAIPDNLSVTLGSLILEQGASLATNSTLSINCAAKIGVGASIGLGTGARIRFGSDVVNNGSILAGTLEFYGSTATQKFSGNGIAKVHRLENKQTSSGNALLLESPIQITGFVEPGKGILNSNGNLTLLSSPETSASLLPIPDLNEAKIIGNVNVQTYISGSYPNPATARGWRLLSSPVYTSANGSTMYYGLNAYKNSMYITGKGGSANGFDPSPLNGGTIYTHDQALPGTLSQKYTAVPNINSIVPIAKGIYVFSRGHREAPNAFVNQIQSAPFSNPSGYIITHTGLIYTGDLTVGVFNKNSNEIGEGFNLLGNPYPSPIQWGSLTKANLSPFVWLFEPLNNGYIVKNASSTIIPSGSGFFVKVLDGNSSGSLKFEEASKYTGDNIQLPKVLIARKNSVSPLSTDVDVTTIPKINDKGSQLTIQLKRDAFEQQYTISFISNGEDSVNDRDAVKIGEGYVSIAGLVNGTKLAFDERKTLTEKREIELYIKGWASGYYCLNFKDIEAFASNISVTLSDKYLNLSRKISASKSNYCFSMDEKVMESWENRFVLTLEPSSIKDFNDVSEGNEITLYPNPIGNKFYLKNNSDKVFNSRLTISSIYGQILSTKHIIIGADTNEINVEYMAKGIYLINLFEKTRNKHIKTFKVLKR